VGEYPRTVLEFRDWFADDAACRDYLAKLRWPEGFRCPVCGEPDHWVTARACVTLQSQNIGVAWPPIPEPMQQAVELNPVPAKELLGGRRFQMTPTD
jgi:hypothetical protein